MSSKTKLNYGSALQELQLIVSQLQDEAISIDDLSERVARAAVLIQFCKEKLRATEKEVEELFGEKPGMAGLKR